MKSIKKTLLLVLLTNYCFTYSQDVVKTKNDTSSHIGQYQEKRFYYFPNIEAYYDSAEIKYYFRISGNWIVADNLPPNYGGYSLYNKIKLSVSEFNPENPSQFLYVHKKMYPYSAKGKFINQNQSNTALAKN